MLILLILLAHVIERTPLFCEKLTMYRHEKTPQNATALLNSVSGFEENPTETFLAEMQKIVPEMQDLPFFHHNIECFCPKFVLFEGQWVGSVLTPWMISVVILPGPQQTWEPRELGDKITVQLPYNCLLYTS